MVSVLKLQMSNLQKKTKKTVIRSAVAVSELSPSSLARSRPGHPISIKHLRLRNRQVLSYRKRNRWRQPLRKMPPKTHNTKTK